MTTSPQFRPFHADDAEAVAALFVRAFGDARPLDAAEVRDWLRGEASRPEMLSVLEIDGQVEGYGDLWHDDDEVVLDVAAPGHWQSFLDWAERDAAERETSRVRLYIPDGHELAELVSKRGYRLARSSYTLEAPLDSVVPRGVDGIELRSYRDADADELRLAFNEVFADDAFFHAASPDDFRELYVGARGFDPEFWLLAWDGSDLAGFALGSPERFGDPELGWIGGLGVRGRWRRRGIGLLLLRSMFAALHRRGALRVGLGVDTDNPGALALYERAGMRTVRRGDHWVLER